MIIGNDPRYKLQTDCKQPIYDHGCYYMCLLAEAQRMLASDIVMNVQDVEDFYDVCVGKGYIGDESFMKLPHKVMSELIKKNCTVKWIGKEVEITENQFVVAKYVVDRVLLGRLENDAVREIVRNVLGGKSQVVHFVLVNENYDIVYDPWKNGVSVCGRYGYAKDYRLFTYGG